MGTWPGEAGGRHSPRGPGECRLQPGHHRHSDNAAKCGLSAGGATWSSAPEVGAATTRPAEHTEECGSFSLPGPLPAPWLHSGPAAPAPQPLTHPALHSSRSICCSSAGQGAGATVSSATWAIRTAGHTAPRGRHQASPAPSRPRLADHSRSSGRARVSCSGCGQHGAQMWGCPTGLGCRARAVLAVSRRDRTQGHPEGLLPSGPLDKAKHLAGPS